MMHRPWDCAQPDEWLPQSLRLCWGGDSDGGGGATTGGGDWGSSGAADFSGFNSGFEGPSTFGAGGSEFGFGQGGGGGDWGSFGPTSYGGFDAPNPTFADIAGPNPGVTTGGGDWGSAGTTSFAGTGGAPGGGFWGDSGGATAYGGGGGGGLFGDYGGGGYTGGGQQGGGSFGGFGTTGTLGASNAVSSVSGPAFADTAGVGSLAGPAGQASSGAPTTSEAQVESAGGGETTSESEAAPSEEGDTSVAPSESQFGEPSAPEAEAAPEAEPAQQDSFASRFDAVAPAQQDTFASRFDAATPEAEPSAFGPQSLDAQSVGEQGKSGQQQDSFDSRFGFETAPPQDSFDSRFALDPNTDTTNWGAVFEAPSDPAYQNERSDGPIGPIAEPSWFQSLISDIPGVTTPAWAQDIGKSLTDVNTWLAPQNQGAINFLTSGALNPNNWVDVQSPMGPAWGPQSTAFDLQALGEQGKAGQLQSTFDSRFAIDPNTDTTNWGAVFEGATPPSEDIAPAIEAFIPGGQQTDFTGYESLPGGAVTAFIPGGQTTDFEYASPATAQPAPAPDAAHPYAETLDSGPPGVPTTTDDASTPGGDPALSGAAANAPEGQPTEGQPGTLGQPAVAPAQGGQTFVTDAAVNATVNAVSVALDKAGVSPITQDAVTEAVYNAALNLASPADQANAAATAALQTGASPAQAAAIANATYNVAMAQSGFTPGQPGQQQQAPPGEQQPGAPEGEQTTSTTSAFIPGQLQTNFDYPSSQPAPQSLIDMAPAQPGTPPAPTMALPPVAPADVPPGTPETRPAEPAAEPQEHDDAPEPRDTSQPPQDPNAPRPPENIPGQVTGARGTYTNDRMDNPRTNSNYRDSGRTDYPQGRPGINFRTARQAGIEPLFRTDDINVRDVDARLVENINRAMRDMPANLRDGLVASSGWRPAHRGEAHEHGQDERTSQESVYTRYNPNGRNIGPAAQPGRSNHGPGRAIDFHPGPALTWLRAHAREYGLETLGRNFDIPHIQLQRGQGGQRPSAQEQAEQRALDAQNRQLAQDRGLIGGQGNQQVATPLPRARPTDAPLPAEIGPQPDVAQPQPPADIPAPVVALPPVAPPDPVAPRPPADIPAPALTPPRAGRADPVMQTRATQNILAQATAHLTTKSGEAEFTAASVVGAKALAAAGIPADMARALMTQGAYAGAAKAGYGPSSMFWGIAKGKIDAGIDAALQGYQPAKPGAVQGPPSPFAPGKQGAAPFGQQYASMSQLLGEPAPEEDLGREGDVSAREAIRPWDIMPLEQLSPMIAPPAPQSPAYQPPPGPVYTPGGPGMFNPFRGNEAALPFDTRFLAKGGHVAKDEPVVVGEEGPETFVPDHPGTVVPHMPQSGGGEDFGRWPKLPTPDYPGRYAGVGREMKRQMREAQNPIPSLIDLVDSGRLPLNAANWRAMLNDPSLIALGQSRIGTVDAPAPAPAAAPPDPTSPMAQALGYGSIKRRPMQIGRQSY